MIEKWETAELLDAHGDGDAVKRLNASDYAGACNAILDWKYVGKVDCSASGNRVCPGLWKRRQQLHKQCLGDAS